MLAATIAASACALAAALVCLGVLAQVKRALPVQLAADLDAQRSRTQECERLTEQVRELIVRTDRALREEMDSHGQRLTTWRLELETTQEAVHTLLDKVESKRKQIAAKESKMRQRENGQEEGDPNDRAFWERRAREQGQLD